MLAIEIAHQPEKISDVRDAMIAAPARDSPFAALVQFAQIAAKKNLALMLGIVRLALKKRKPANSPRNTGRNKTPFSASAIKTTRSTGRNKRELYTMLDRHIPTTTPKRR